MQATQRFQRFLLSLPRTHEHPCAYYPGRRARLRAFLFENRLPPAYMDVLINRGFRRSGDLHYRTDCPGCFSCLSYRIPVNAFLPSRAQKRVVRRNRDLDLRVHDAPLPTAEKQQLYLDYQYRQHFLRPVPGKAEKSFDPQRTLETMLQQMYTGSANGLEMELRNGGALAGFAVFDAGETTLSAVYSVYDLREPRRSLGTYIIVALLDWARENGYRWANLGYFLPGHPKMDYKRRFGPAQILDPADGVWREAGAFMASWREPGTGPRKSG